MSRNNQRNVAFRTYTYLAVLFKTRITGQLNAIPIVIHIYTAGNRAYRVFEKEITYHADILLKKAIVNENTVKHHLWMQSYVVFLRFIGVLLWATSTTAFHVLFQLPDFCRHYGS